LDVCDIISGVSDDALSAAAGASIAKAAPTASPRLATIANVRLIVVIVPLALCSGIVNRSSINTGICGDLSFSGKPRRLISIAADLARCPAADRCQQIAFMHLAKWLAIAASRCLDIALEIAPWLQRNGLDCR
jgi:hypothetical protein